MPLVARDEPLLRATYIDPPHRDARRELLIEILKASGPAILNNVAAPMTAAIQLALLGHAGETHVESARLVAVWTAVTSVTTFVVGIAQFVVVVTMSRVGHALGAKDWSLLGRMIRAVILAALAVGVFLSASLWIGRVPLLTALSLDGASHHGGKAAHELAADFLPAAILRVPPLLLLRAATSILCGYQRVRLASAINLGLAVLDTATFYIALHALRLGLPALGWAIAATCGCASLVALLAVACQPPDPTVSLFGCFCDDDFGGGNNSAETPANSAQPPPTEVDAPTGSARSKASASLLSLACDSINVLIRSLLLSGSVLSLTLATAPLGTAALNAHAVILQLWMLTSYFVDGFADAGTMIGSRLLGEATASAKQRMRSLTLIVVLLGFGTGLAVSGLLGALRDTIIGIFTRDPDTSARLRGPLWSLLCLLQPVNALVFAYDGLLYATHSFRFVRNALALGVLGVYVPALGLVLGLHHTLLAVWGAKAGLNLWRCLTAVFRIHCQLWPTWKAQEGAVSGTGVVGGTPSGATHPLNAERIHVVEQRDASQSENAYSEADFVAVD